MFKINDYVVKTNCGVCQIVGEEEKQVAPTMPKEKYFRLVSVDGKLTVYQPVKSAEKFLRPVMNEKQADEFISDLSKEKYAWNNKDNERVQELKKKVDSNPTIEALGFVAGGYYRRMADGKNISKSDKNFLDTLEAKLFPILGFSLKCDDKQVREKFDNAFGIQREEQA